MATWSADGRRIAVIDHDRALLVDPDNSDSTITFEGVIPAQQYPPAEGLLANPEIRTTWASP